MINFLSGFMRAVSAVMLVAMMLITCSDVAGNIFGFPILGSEEIVSLMAAILIACVLPAAHQERAHIGVDLLYMRFSPRVKRINNLILGVLKIGFFGLMSFECVKYGLELRRIGQVTAILEIPNYLVIFVVAFGCMVLTLVLAAEFFNLLFGVIHE